MAFANCCGGGGGASAPTAAAATMALVVVVLAGTASGDFAADRAECADRLMGLATCLTYVQAKATARAPTPDCCAGLKQVVTGSKKCLCVLVKDRDEPALGFQINVTRAMDLPSICNIPATFSDCPKMLNMSDDSPDAQIFKDYAKKHEFQNGTTIPAAASGSAVGTSARTQATSGACAGRQPCKLFFYLVSALLASVSVLA
ncbi:non-specific lipid transfer protein GPI-anchored 14-like [Phragmites australis]|uniref:non-specific lipid transfer protein GPI-anchored 14-like n=1 Tax=Phragmites australis TaxID=29695 RepID=UPI002D78A85E|nr:non-specific lipid transfer protein GPI-anchored 14-like [Phragmites australis]